MEVTGNEAGPISNEEAQLWIHNFENSVPQGTILSHLFGRNIVDQVLAQPGCKGLRIYNAEDSQAVRKLIIYGVDSQNNDLTSVIAEFSMPCPPYCNTGKPPKP